MTFLKTSLELAVALLAIGSINPAAAQSVSFQGLGFLPGGSLSVATGVSADGTVAVGYGYTSTSQEAFSWKNGTITGLGFPAGS